MNINKSKKDGGPSQPRLEPFLNSASRDPDTDAPVTCLLRLSLAYAALRRFVA